MKRLYLVLVVAAAVLATGAFVSMPVTEADDIGTPLPVLSCADVNADGPVTGGDISKVVGKFGTVVGQAAYHPLYDLTASDSVVGADISTVVADFGLVCSSVSPVDNEIAMATLAVIDPTFDTETYCGVASFADAGLLTENPTLLASKGYYRSSTDVQGQGIHYVHATFFTDDLFNPCTPEGLVYNNGKLVANLYFVDGDTVGWGCWPGPYPSNCDGNPEPDQVDIDSPPPHCDPTCPTICTPVDGACSWSGSEDGWHLHFDLCTVAIGHPSAAAIPGVSSESQCEDIHNNWPPCSSSKCPGTTWRWDDRVGWMGHLWNHYKINPNGRFADCSPDETGDWKGFNCPQ